METKTIFRKSKTSPDTNANKSETSQSEYRNYLETRLKVQQRRLTNTRSNSPGEINGTGKYMNKFPVAAPPSAETKPYRSEFIWV